MCAPERGVVLRIAIGLTFNLFPVVSIPCLRSSSCHSFAMPTCHHDVSSASESMSWQIATCWLLIICAVWLCYCAQAREARDALAQELAVLRKCSENERASEKGEWEKEMSILKNEMSRLKNALATCEREKEEREREWALLKADWEKSEQVCRSFTCTHGQMRTRTCIRSYMHAFILAACIGAHITTDAAWFFLCI